MLLRWRQTGCLDVWAVRWGRGFVSSLWCVSLVCGGVWCLLVCAVCPGASHPSSCDVPGGGWEGVKNCI